LLGKIKEVKNSTLQHKSHAYFILAIIQQILSKNITIALPFFSPKTGSQPKGSRELTIYLLVDFLCTGPQMWMWM
jgi:hypothetical protein